MKGIELVNMIVEQGALDKEVFVSGTETTDDEERTSIEDLQMVYNEDEETQEGVILINGYIES